MCHRPSGFDCGPWYHGSGFYPLQLDTQSLELRHARDPNIDYRPNPLASGLEAPNTLFFEYEVCNHKYYRGDGSINSEVTRNEWAFKFFDSTAAGQDLSSWHNQFPFDIACLTPDYLVDFPPASVRDKIGCDLNCLIVPGYCNPINCTLNIVAQRRLYFSTSQTVQVRFLFSLYTFNGISSDFVVAGSFFSSFFFFPFFFSFLQLLCLQMFDS